MGKLPSILKMFGLAISLMGLGGCATTPLTEVKQFGQTTSELSVSASEALKYLDQVEVQRKLAYVASRPNEGITLNELKPFFRSDARADDPKSKDSVDSKRLSLELRLKLLKSLANYAKSLEAIATAEHYKQLDAASKELNSALVDLSATYVAASESTLGLSEKDMGLIATAFNAVGRAKINRAQYEVLQRIVPAADLHVKKAADLIADDLASDSEIEEYANSAVMDIQSSMMKAYNRERLEKIPSTYESRLAQLEAIEKYYRASITVPPLFSAVSAGARNMATAHNALADALKNNSLGSEKLAKALAEFMAQADAVKAFKESLDENK